MRCGMRYDHLKEVEETSKDIKRLFRYIGSKFTFKKSEISVLHPT